MSSHHARRGYKPGDYVPFTDRDPSNPTAAGVADPARQQMPAAAGRPRPRRTRTGPSTGTTRPRGSSSPAGAGGCSAYLVDSFLARRRAHPVLPGLLADGRRARDETDSLGNHGDLRPHRGQRQHRGDPGAIGGLLALALLRLQLVHPAGPHRLHLRQDGRRHQAVRSSRRSRSVPACRFVRQLAHIVDSLVCYLGWLWPLWDSKNQTFADKIMSTVVIIQPGRAPPGSLAPWLRADWAACRRS